jgi:hypothetical protein
MPEPRVQRVQVHPLPFAFSTLWVQCGCRLGVQPVNRTFTTDRINRPSRICVGVFHPAVVSNSANLLSIWRKLKRKALLMEFLARNYELCLNYCIRSERIWCREGRSTRMLDHDALSFSLVPFCYGVCPFVNQLHPLPSATSGIPTCIVIELDLPYFFRLTLQV